MTIQLREARITTRTERNGLPIGGRYLYQGSGHDAIDPAECDCGSCGWIRRGLKPPSEYDAIEHGTTPGEYVKCRRRHGGACELCRIAAAGYERARRNAARTKE